MKSTLNTKSIGKIISDIKKDLCEGHQSPINILRDRFTGIPALVISAGPSAVHWQNIASDHSQPMLIIAVKQAIDGDLGLSGRAHLHFANAFNLQKYFYDRTKVLSFMTNSNPPVKLFQPWDVQYNIRPCKDPVIDNIATRHEFGKWTLGHSGLERPFGPGIMYESVIYTLIHMGVKQIATIGWDIASSDGLNKHFDDNRLFGDKATEQRKHTRYLRKLKLINMLSLGDLYAYSAHVRGLKYNKLNIHDWEPPLISASLVPFVRWLRSVGVDIRCFTDSTWFHDEVAIRLDTLSKHVSP